MEDLQLDGVTDCLKGMNACIDHIGHSGISEQKKELRTACMSEGQLGEVKLMLRHK